MVHVCAVYGCQERAGQNCSYKFYPFPRVRQNGINKAIEEIKLRKRLAWYRALRWSDFTESELSYRRICSKHFISGAPARDMDQTNPDWIPSVHMGYQNSNSPGTAKTKYTKWKRYQDRKNKQSFSDVLKVTENNAAAEAQSIAEFEPIHTQDIEQVHFEESQFVNTQGKKTLINRAVPTLMNIRSPPYPLGCQKKSNQLYVDKENKENTEPLSSAMFSQQKNASILCSSQQKQPFSALNLKTASSTTQTKVTVAACYTQTEANIAACCTQTEINVADCCTQIEINVADGYTQTKTDVASSSSGTQSVKNITASCTQTEHEFSPAFYEAQIFWKDIEIAPLHKAIESQNCEPHSVFKGVDDASCLHYTGLKLEAFKMLRKIIGCAKWTYKGSNVSMLSIDDQLFLTLMKLRHNFTLTDLSHRFKCSVATISKVFQAIISVLHAVVFNTFMNKLPSAAKNNLSLPQCFNTFRNCRIILDCTEISCQVPKSMELQRLTFSSYKHRNTFKILIGISPNGTVVFCSKPFPGSMSDRDIVLQSGLLELLDSGDLILADKGFRISDILPQGVALNVPPFLMNKQFTEAEVNETKRIASARVHVERIMQRLKLYKILNCIPSSLFSNITKIVQVCALLINFQSPILNEVKDSFINSTPSNITI